jgi:hypothetical protein
VLVKKIKYILLAFVTMLLLLAIVVACNIAITPESQRSDYLFCRQMSEYTAAFDALNQAVYEQFPVYSDAQFITAGSGGGDIYFWTPTSRSLNAYYISDIPYPQIQEFFEQELQAQNWHLTRKEVFEGNTTYLGYKKQSTCVTMYISAWGEYEAKMISNVSPINEIPSSTISMYRVTIAHAQEAVPGAPTPHPEGSSLIRCFVDEP